MDEKRLNSLEKKINKIELQISEMSSKYFSLYDTLSHKNDKKYCELQKDLSSTKKEIKRSRDVTRELQMIIRKVSRAFKI